MNGAFNYCRVCLQKNDNYTFSSIFINEGYMRKEFFEKFHISYHQYLYEQNKVLICDNCVEEVKKANDYETIAELKSSIVYFKQKFFDKVERKYFNLPLSVDLNEQLTPNFTFVYHPSFNPIPKVVRKCPPAKRMTRLRERMQVINQKVPVEKRKSSVSVAARKKNPNVKKSNVRATTRKATESREKVQKKKTLKLTCGKCFKIFCHQGNRARHERLVHRIKPAFYHQGNQARHERLVDRKKPAVIKKPKKSNEIEKYCGKCGKTFCEKRARQRHEQEVHLKLKPYKCNYCRKKFTRNSFLTHHLLVCKPIYSYRLRRRSLIPTSYKCRFNYDENFN